MTRTSRHEEISSLRVSKLFGRFDHNLEFGEESDISIITAPNGYGKTLILRIVDSLFNGRLHFFREIEFEKIEVSFRSGKSISISSSIIGKKPDLADGEVIFEGSGFGPKVKEYKLDKTPSPSEFRQLERSLPLERLGSDRWVDLPTDRVLTREEVYGAYGHRLPRRFRNSFEIPDWLTTAIGSINAHLVETQRLLSIDDREEHQFSGRRRRATPSSVVEKDAQDLAKRIGKLLQEYANEAQKLDQTFPKRILRNRKKKVSDEQKIREDLTSLTRKQDDLISVGLLEISERPHIRPSDIPKEENIRRILEIYVDDTRTKLSIFDETYNKISLFKELLETRFSFKNIEIDPSQGIRAIDSVSSQVIPLSDLSSGEQHELVLIYELLFTVEEGSLILIDEPELSLHVLWQRKFIEDLQRIQELRKLRVVIATHSPQIIHDNWELVQELKA